MKIDIHKALFTKVLYEYDTNVCDQWGTDEEKYKFQFYFRLSKIYTLAGVVYRAEVPNLCDHDKDLYFLLGRVFLYVHDCGMRYERLKSVLMQKGIWRTLN